MTSRQCIGEEQIKIRTKRNANIELLRIVAMLFIIVHHCVINGYGLQGRLKGEIFSEGGYNIFLSALNTVVIIGVNVFFLISDYYGIRFSVKRLVLLILDLYFYADILIVFSVVIGMQPLGLDVAKSLIFPFCKYWFVNVYIILYILSPVLNVGIEAINKKQALIFTGFFTLLFCLLGFVSEIEAAFLGLNNGYSLTFAIYLYFIGRIMRKYNLWKLPQKFQVAAWLGSVGFTVAGCTVMILSGRIDLAWKLFSYNQIFIVFASIDFVWIFLNMPERGDGEIYQTLAKHTLPIYYIHTCTVFSYYRNQPLQWAAENIGLIAQIVVLILYAVVIFSLCSGIDKIKQAVFECVENKVIGWILKMVKHGSEWFTKS